MLPRDTIPFHWGYKEIKKLPVATAEYNEDQLRENAEGRKRALSLFGGNIWYTNSP